MEFLYRIYTRKLICVKVPKIRRIPVKKEKTTGKASKINGSGTSVHLMDKTDILLDDTERNRFSGRIHAGKRLFRASIDFHLPL